MDEIEELKIVIRDVAMDIVDPSIVNAIGLMINVLETLDERIKRIEDGK